MLKSVKNQQVEAGVAPTSRGGAVLINLKTKMELSGFEVNFMNGKSVCHVPFLLVVTVFQKHPILLKMGIPPMSAQLPYCSRVRGYL
jgi:hypothetical protein